MRSGNGCVTGCNRDLVKIEDHVARYIKSVDGRLLVFIHLQKTSFSVSCTGRRSPRLDKSYRNAGIDRGPAVRLIALDATSFGGPAATMRPPSSPAPGPTSTKSLAAATDISCSITITVLPDLTNPSRYIIKFVTSAG